MPLQLFAANKVPGSRSKTTGNRGEINHHEPNRLRLICQFFFVAACGLAGTNPALNLQQTLQQQPHLSHLGHLIDPFLGNNVDAQRPIIFEAGELRY